MNNNNIFLEIKLNKKIWQIKKILIVYFTQNRPQIGLFYIFDDGDVCTVKSNVTQLQLNTIYLKGKQIR